jgi:hypothetical protein
MDIHHYTPSSFFFGLIWTTILKKQLLFSIDHFDSLSMGEEIPRSKGGGTHAQIIERPIEWGPASALKNPEG